MAISPATAKTAAIAAWQAVCPEGALSQDLNCNAFPLRITKPDRNYFIVGPAIPLINLRKAMFGKGGNSAAQPSNQLVFPPKRPFFAKFGRAEPLNGEAERIVF